MPRKGRDLDIAPRTTRTPPPGPRLGRSGGDGLPGRTADRLRPEPPPPPDRFPSSCWKKGCHSGCWDGKPWKHWRFPGYRYYRCWRQCSPFGYSLVYGCKRLYYGFGGFYGGFGGYSSSCGGYFAQYYHPYSSYWWLWPTTYVGRYDYWSPYETLSSYSSTLSPLSLSPATAAPGCSATPSEAWILLYNGDSASSLEAFTCLADVDPNDGLRLLGLALSAGMQGRHDDTVSAARRAVRVDPQSLSYIQGDRQLDAVFTSLLEHYEHRAIHVYGDLDALYMVAMLRYFRNELAAARYTVDIDLTLGDTDDSSRLLRRFIAEAQEQQAPQPKQQTP